jgi:AcrR family transcriptional regulator
MIHEALIYSTDAEYAHVLAPFLGEAVAEGGAAIAVASPERIELLRDSLGREREEVAFFVAEEWYRRPGATLAEWRTRLDECDGARTVRAVGEVPFAGDAAALARWTSYESLFNHAFADREAWVICPYDTRGLPEEIVAGARRTHPVVSAGTHRGQSPEHFAAHELGAVPAPSVTRTGAKYGAPVSIDAHDPIALRRAVAWDARAAGLPGDVVEDLILAINELARVAQDATVRIGRAGGEWLCEIARGGLPLNESELGVLIARLICDTVEIERRKDRELIRLLFGERHASPRRRIVEAGAELFARKGVRATGVNAIIAESGVAKATFYAHFPSKDDLVRAWLEGSPVRWFDGLRAEVEARAATPDERLTVFFDVLGEWLAADDFRGCQTLNAAAEARYSDPAAQALADLQSEIEEYLRSAATDAGLADADRLARQLLLLVQGAIVTAAAERSSEPAVAARLVAARLVASGTRS